MDQRRRSTRQLLCLAAPSSGGGQAQVYHAERILFEPHLTWKSARHVNDNGDVIVQRSNSKAWLVTDIGGTVVEIVGPGNQIPVHGFTENGQAVVHVYGNGIYLAGVWSIEDGLTLFADVPGSPTSVGRGINERGQVTLDSATGTELPFLYTPGKGFEQIPLPPGHGLIDSGDVNNYEELTILTSLIGGGHNYTFRWDRVNGLSDIGWMPASDKTLAEGINDDGTAMGTASMSNGHSLFLWDEPDAPPMTVVTEGTVGIIATGSNELADQVGLDGVDVSDFKPVICSSTWAAGRQLRAMLHPSEQPDWVLHGAEDINNKGQIALGGK